MKLKDRFVNAYKAFTANSHTRWTEYSNLMQFLGLDDVAPSNLSEATYFACLKVLSESIGKLPLKVLQYNETQGVTNARRHPLYRVIHDRPNPYMTATTFWSTIEYNRNHYGNAYALIDGAADNLQLWILPSNEVQVWYDDAKILSDIPDVYYMYSSGEKMYRFGSEEILHFKTSNTLDGIVGIAVQEQLKSTIGGNVKAQNLINRMYDSGFTAKAALQYTGQLSDENVKTLVKGIEAYSKGDLKSEGIENIIPIPLGFSLQPLNVKLADNQFVEVKQYTALQIASAFGIKPYQIGDYTKSSYASAEAQQLSFYVDTLLYIVKQYEEELTYKLLADEEIKKGLHVKFNIQVILRADLQTQINTLATGVNSFIYTPNEARALLDLDSREGGDALLGNGASIPVEYAGSQYTQTEAEQQETDESTAKISASELMTIIDAVHTDKLTYDQAVNVLVYSIGYDDSTARQMLGNPDDYDKPTVEKEPPEEMEQAEDTEESTEDGQADEDLPEDEPSDESEEDQGKEVT